MIILLSLYYKNLGVKPAKQFKWIRISNYDKVKETELKAKVKESQWELESIQPQGPITFWQNTKAIHFLEDNKSSINNLRASLSFLQKYKANIP